MPACVNLRCKRFNEIRKTVDEPLFVKSSCVCCDGKIEFDGHLIGSDEVRMVICPHCNERTPISWGLVMAGAHPEPWSDFEHNTWWNDDPSSRTDFATMAAKGAARNDPKSMVCLAIAFHKGIASPQDQLKAVQWMRKAADAGNADAQYNLGVFYNDGDGVPKDDLEAFSLWLKAAKQGHSIAQNNVGYSYELGEIVQRDYIEAYKWMSLAAEQAFAGAQAHCNEIAKKMTVGQQEESNRRIEQFLSNRNQVPISWWDKAMLERQARRRTSYAVAEPRYVPSQKIVVYERTTISRDVKQLVWRRDGGACVRCGSRYELEYDHDIPVTKGGSNGPENIQLLCRPCNRSKGAKIQ